MVGISAVLRQMRKKTCRFLFCGAILAFLSSCGSMVGPSTQNSGPKTVTLDPMLAGKSLAESSFRATFVAAFRQPITSARQGLAVLWHRPREVFAGNLPVDLEAKEALPETPGTAAFERLLDQKGFPKPENGTLKWLVDGEEFFPELDRQISSASKSINAQVYIFDNDDIAVRYADKLRKRSADVKVRVMFDDFGSATSHLSSPKTKVPASFQPPPDMRIYLESGSDVRVHRTLNPWLVADHTKLLVFDDRTAILGGMNIGREYYNEWHDLMVRVDGPVVAKLADIFSRAWRKSGPLGDLALLSKPKHFEKPQALPGAIPLRVLRTEPGVGRHEIRDSMLLAIRCAKKRILIENPYFASDEILAAVRAAAMRGVDVRVVLPAEGDSRIMDAGNLATARVLIWAGAKVYRYPRMTHMKVMVCDDWATAGSANLDTLSMRINRELNIAFSNKAEVERLVAAVFTPDIARSRRIRIEETKDTKTDLAEILADQL
jgi:cardiolipin synthase